MLCGFVPRTVCDASSRMDENGAVLHWLPRGPSQPMLLSSCKTQLQHLMLARESTASLQSSCVFCQHRGTRQGFAQVQRQEHCWSGVNCRGTQHPNIPTSQCPSLCCCVVPVTPSCYFSLSPQASFLCEWSSVCWEMMLHTRIWYQCDSIYWNSIISNLKYINLSPALITKILSASVEVFISNNCMERQSNKNKKYMLIIHLNANTWLFDLGCKCWNIFNIKVIDQTFNNSSFKICAYSSVSKLFQS